MMRVQTCWKHWQNSGRKREDKEQSYVKGAVRESVVRPDAQRRRLGSLVEHALARALEAMEMGDQVQAAQ